MRRMLLVISLAALAVAGWPASRAWAQDKMARGTVTAVGADTVTINARDQEMKFNLDEKTVIEAAGAGTKARQAQRAGHAGPKLNEVVKVGQGAEVTYTEMGGMMHATRIRSILPSAAMADVKPGEKTAMGEVQSVAADSFTVGSAGSTQTFTYDASTKVVGKGAGTAARAKGGTAPFTDLVHKGDRVSVSYHESGTTLHASEVRVTMKALKPATN